jgi:sigma-B regulation protein RsbU (phosphoserine phosphatase)
MSLGSANAMARVLVADDQPDILQALRLLLTDAGLEADLVTTVSDALGSIGRSPYDLLLMDLNYTRDTTSGREGLELIDAVRAKDASLPIVVMTGWGTIDTAVEAMRRGARSFVQKPWDDATLVEVVRREIASGDATRRRDARLARETEEAQLIQRALLPSSMPSVEGCQIAARWTPAAGLGGDCYDLLPFGAGRLGVSIADVIGKGLPAALLMSNLQAAVRAFATAGVDPSQTVASVNRLLCRNIETGKFVTFCYVVIDTTDRRLAFANAGHFPPLLLRDDGSVDRLATSGLVLGVAPDWSYGTGSFELRSGDRLVCFTDGITEALSPEGDEFGDDRLVDRVRAGRHRSADQLADDIMAAVGDWTGAGPQDDATLIVVSMA